MNVEIVTAVTIIVAWCLVAYRVEAMKPKTSSRVAMVRHVAMGTALAISLFAPGAWGKLALALGVLVVYLLSVQVRPAHPPQAGRQAMVVVMQDSPVARALEADRADGLARARQRQG